MPDEDTAENSALLCSLREGRDPSADGVSCGRFTKATGQVLALGHTCSSRLGEEGLESWKMSWESWWQRLNLSRVVKKAKGTWNNWVQRSRVSLTREWSKKEAGNVLKDSLQVLGIVYSGDKSTIKGCLFLSGWTSICLVSHYSETLLIQREISPSKSLPQELPTAFLLFQAAKTEKKLLLKPPISVLPFSLSSCMNLIRN